MDPSVLTDTASYENYLSKFTREVCFSPHTKLVLLKHDVFSLQVNRVFSGGYAYVTSETNVEIEMSLRCDAAVIKEKFGTFSKGIGMQNNSVYKDIFSELYVKYNNCIQFQQLAFLKCDFCYFGAVLVEANKVVLLLHIKYSILMSYSCWVILN